MRRRALLIVLREMPNLHARELRERQTNTRTDIGDAPRQIEHYPSNVSLNDASMVKILVHFKAPGAALKPPKKDAKEAKQFHPIAPATQSRP
jgi:hypothetical protein